MQKQVTQSEVEQATIDFIIAKQDADATAKNFNKIKQEYYSFMNSVFDSGMYGDATSLEFTDEVEDDEGVKEMLYRSTRSVRTTVTWDVDATKKRLPKYLQGDVIKRQRDLIDLKGLVNYMRSIGGNAKKFWSFFNTTEFVDQDELDQLVELGEITLDDLSGCYTITTGNPTFRVMSKEIKYDESGGIIKG